MHPHVRHVSHGFTCTSQTDIYLLVSVATAMGPVRTGGHRTDPGTGGIIPFMIPVIERACHTSHVQLLYKKMGQKFG